MNGGDYWDLGKVVKFQNFIKEKYYLLSEYRNCQNSEFKV